LGLWGELVVKLIEVPNNETGEKGAEQTCDECESVREGGESAEVGEQQRGECYE